MNHSIYTPILQAKQQGRPLLMVLLDPEKPSVCQSMLPYLHLPDGILVGGSSAQNCSSIIPHIRSHSDRPILLFPGNITQFTPQADALLFLSLLSSTDPQFLITPHIQMARTIAESGIETIPMGYILVDGGSVSSVQRITQSQPIAATDIPRIVQTAVAGELLGKQLIYLEAGSGAKNCVPPAVIQAVKQQLHVPLIVGGGIRTLEQMDAAIAAGADIIVIGNHFEQHPEDIPTFISHIHP